MVQSFINRAAIDIENNNDGHDWRTGPAGDGVTARLPDAGLHPEAPQVLTQQRHTALPLMLAGFDNDQKAGGGKNNNVPSCC